MNKTAKTNVAAARRALFKSVKESAVIKEVQAVIDATGLEVQRLNSGAFVTGAGRRCSECRRLCIFSAL